MAVKDVLEMAKKNKAEIVDLKFIDVPGLWQHFSIPATELSADVFEQGLGFDGSSIRGFQSINESDMILIPDPETAMMDPFTDPVKRHSRHQLLGSRDRVFHFRQHPI